MRSEWDDPELVGGWAAAMAGEGDAWRRALVNPLVLDLAARVARGADPFAGSVFEPLCQDVRQEARADGAGLRLDGVTVLDLGCGEGYLGRLLIGRGARHIGLDSSAALLRLARERNGGVSDLHEVDLEREAAVALAGIEEPALVVATVLLDHLPDLQPLLEAVAARLRRCEREVPFLCITLAPERYERPGAVPHRPGETIARREALIESCQRPVTVWVRSRRCYERVFRDAGLFVRRAEPLFFHRRHVEAPVEQRDDASRRPVFWSWLLSARRGRPAEATWPAGTDAAALGDSVAALARTVDSATRVLDFRPGEMVIRVHNMGGELYAVQAGAAQMMDGGQELMTFRAGEVLGDLETPDETGQCGSFPFDVVAGAQGCRVAIFNEAASSAVLASNREIGTRFFRLLRDRLRLALWHYDIRELVGEYLERGNERLEKRLLHRCARALLWAAAIESRGRARRLGLELAFIDPETIARRFKPGTERIDFGVVIRQLHLLRMIDAFPGAALRKEEEARSARSWDALVASVTERYLQGGALDATLRATVTAHAGRLRVAGQLSKDGNRTRQFQEVVDDLSALPVRLPDWPARLERWSAHIARAHRFWEDRNPWLIVLRDVPGLRRIALGDAAGIAEVIGARADYLLQDARRPTWELVTAQAASPRRQEYIDVLDAFLSADLADLAPGGAASGRLAFSSEGGA